MAGFAAARERMLAVEEAANTREAKEIIAVNVAFLKNDVCFIFV